MRIAYIGCVESSFALLEQVLELPEAEVVAVVTRRSSSFNSDFRSLAPLAERAGAPCLAAQGNDQQEMARFLGAASPDVIFCFGWSYLLRPELLALAPRGAIGYHPAALPEHRGRHPIIWALALGLDATRSSFFSMDAGADSGDLVSEADVAIHPQDDAGSLYARLVEVGRGQVAEITRRLAAGELPRRPQDPTRAGWWRKRGFDDGRVDWRMPAAGIHNLVRALARPYPGAHWLDDGGPVKLWRTRPVTAAVPRDAEPGKILAVADGVPTVRCGDGAIRLLEHEHDGPFTAGSYLR